MIQHDDGFLLANDGHHIMALEEGGGAGLGDQRTAVRRRVPPPHHQISLQAIRQG